MGQQLWRAQKEELLLNDFTSSMVNVHCICHRLALACADTGDDYKFINSFETNPIELSKFFKNSSKRLKIYIRTTLKCKEFDTLSNKCQKNIVKKVKKPFRTRWLSLHDGVNTVFDKYEGLVKTLLKIQCWKFKCLGWALKRFGRSTKIFGNKSHWISGKENKKSCLKVHQFYLSKHWC